MYAVTKKATRDFDTVNFIVQKKLLTYSSSSCCPCECIDTHTYMTMSNSFFISTFIINTDYMLVKYRLSLQVILTLNKYQLVQR